MDAQKYHEQNYLKKQAKAGLRRRSVWVHDSRFDDFKDYVGRFKSPKKGAEDGRTKQDSVAIPVVKPKRGRRRVTKGKKP